MVDAVPFDGDYTNTRVQNNTLEAAENTLMRVGIGIGARVWSDDTDTVLRGGIVTENILQGGGMGYGIAVGGVEDFTITENESRVVSKKHSGVRGQRCLVPLEADEEAAFGMSREEREVGIVKNPEPMAFLRNGESISGGEVQEDFVEGDFTYREFLVTDARMVSYRKAILFRNSRKDLSQWSASTLNTWTTDPSDLKLPSPHYNLLPTPLPILAQEPSKTPSRRKPNRNPP